jgi:hypothetical protein
MCVCRIFSLSAPSFSRASGSASIKNLPARPRQEHRGGRERSSTAVAAGVCHDDKYSDAGSAASAAAACAGLVGGRGAGPLHVLFKGVAVGLVAKVEK